MTSLCAAAQLPHSHHRLLQWPAQSTSNSTHIRYALPRYRRSGEICRRENLHMAKKPFALVSLLICAWPPGCNKPGQTASQDSATFDPDGTAHITRVVPMPSTVSPEAQKWLASLSQPTPGPESLA